MTSHLASVPRHLSKCGKGSALPSVGTLDSIGKLDSISANRPDSPRSEAMACAMVDQPAPSDVERSEKSGTAIEKRCRLSLTTLVSADACCNRAWVTRLKIITNNMCRAIDFVRDIRLIPRRKLLPQALIADQIAD